MGHVLKNQNIEIHLDFPLENYNFSRFDWTGKIVKVKFKDIQLSGVEGTDGGNEHRSGKGFYNEFGIDQAVGFDETRVGGWFHKIGVGLLRKDDDQYLFSKNYEVRPAKFTVSAEDDSVRIICKSEAVNGYSYLLEKEIQLLERAFTIKYSLRNTGTKDIVTNEYVHNFTAINEDPIGRNYVLKFPFQLKPKLFGETVNPERKIDLGSSEIKFNGSPREPFFFSNLSGNEEVAAKWELINTKSNIAISETGSFTTDKVNLWGGGHVICPELFHHVLVKPGASSEWSRTYQVYQQLS